jgi:hypothetical protein
VRLEEKGDDGFGFLLVGGVRIWELAEHEGFLDFGFEVGVDEQVGEDDEVKDAAAGEDSAEDGEEEAGIDGVADIAVGAGQDEFMAFLKSGLGAPIGAEDATRPDGDGNAGGAEDEAEDFEGVAGFVEMVRQPGETTIIAEDEQDDDDQQSEEATTGAGGMDGAFGAAGGSDPVDNPKDPQDDKGVVEIHEDAPF